VRGESTVSNRGEGEKTQDPERTQMSEEGDERTLRRSARTRKGTELPVVIESSGGSETDNIETETETVAGWDCLRHEESETESETVAGWSGVCREEREWSTQAQSDFVVAERGDTMSRRDHESKDLGRGATPAPSVNEMMQLFIYEGKRRDDEQREERRRAMEQQNLLMQSLMDRRTTSEPVPE